ncbi:unnamed protein product [Rhizophagus irregularis]|uniref:Uncharacterized protein n=2 Tax=Rhizophagus irregularis TaxID=588596 RepID=A0A2I1FU70_9GLOM|nr:Pcl7p [Rhizophagus irregularis DAOM 197198w]PKK80798.1 hypothetical protein RhiirC2_723438 [Rhizophagus irregularis]GBC30091.1 hypothetical protein GLOIN_2v1615986 [Rhizophagus irregularis DAOM 181602=DAOM 197198]PKY37863.1 hypothetical protein RhiirA4_450782 [Rhizophagus irregularis]UZO19078.1 hypothetical protein OCT59_010380 [Rhizophagus irregularis]
MKYNLISTKDLISSESPNVLYENNARIVFPSPISTDSLSSSPNLRCSNSSLKLQSNFISKDYWFSFPTSMHTSYLNFTYSSIWSSLKLPAASHNSILSQNLPASSPVWWSFPYFKYMIAKDNRRVNFGPITQILFDGSLSFPNPEQYYCSLFLHPELLERQRQEEANAEAAAAIIDNDKPDIDIHAKWADFATEIIWQMLPKLPRREKSSSNNENFKEFKEFGYKLIKSTDCLGPVIVIMLKYVQRIILSGKDFDIYPYEPEFVLLVVGLILSHKWLEDSTYSNKSWAEMSGIPLELLGNMERDFLYILDNSIYISEEEYNRWLEFLLNYQYVDNNVHIQGTNNCSWPRVNFQSAVGAVNTELNKKKLEVDFSTIIDLITDDLESLCNESSPLNCPLTPKDNSLLAPTSKDFFNTYNNIINTRW